MTVLQNRHHSKRIFDVTMTIMDQFIAIIIGAKKQILMKFQAFLPPTRARHMFSFLVLASFKLVHHTTDGKVFYDYILFMIELILF